MKISYYNPDKDKAARSHNKKRKLFTISFHNRILEEIQLENSYRGCLLWIVTPKTVRVFGYWKQGGCGGSKKFYQSWNNDHCGCC